MRLAMTHRPRAWGVIASLALLASLFSTGSASAGETEPDPMTGAPAVGDCYDITYKQAYGHAIAERTVDCSRRHTLAVVGVGTVPDSVDLASIDWDKPMPEALGRAMDKVCTPGTNRTLGTSKTARALSLYSQGYWWFTPTDAQVAAGARWFSCEVGIDDGRKLLPLPDGQPTRLTKPVDSDVARCADTRGDFVVCSKRHAWRATTAFLVNKKLTEKSQKAAVGKCARRVSSREWRWSTIPTEVRQFAVACFSKTSR
jgi:hypothetical protein